MNGRGNVQAMLRDCITAAEAKLTALGRKHIAKDNFALPGERKYPIHDIDHARNALSRASGKPEEKQVRAAVYKKYPSLKPSESSAPGPRSFRETSSFKVLEAMPDGKDGEKVFKVILISEGPGNRRNKNYYGPEAVSSAVKAFEGKWCYLNHQDAAEAETLPERRIEDKAGYFKNLGIIKVKEGTACAGELHCDLSESGAMLAAKILSALKYKESFPDNDLEYVGFSVNADGNAEPRDMTDKGGSTQDNYVTEITDGDSCDLVTTPARGGRGLAVIKESEGGPQEAGMKKKLTQVLAALTEAMKSVKGDEAKKLTEAQKSLAALVKEADSVESEADAWAKKGESESDEDHLKRLHGMAKAVAAHLGGKAGAAEDAADGDPKDGEPEPDGDEGADAKESKADAIMGLIRESGLPKDLYDKAMIADLVKKPYREAKAIITKDARLAKSIRESAGSVASLHRVFHESASDNTAAFLTAAKGE